MDLISDNIKGLQGKLSELRKKEAEFLKYSGIQEQIEKRRCDIEIDEKKLDDHKLQLTDAQNEKTILLSGVKDKICQELDTVLPHGESYINIEDFEIGWIYENYKSPYDSLSGGELVAFNAALASTLKANIVILEAAELDDNKIRNFLRKAESSDKQYIINTCHEFVGDVCEIERWNTIFLSENRL